MAITAENINLDITGAHKVSYGSITVDATTEVDINTGLVNVDSIQLEPSATIGTIAGGIVPVTPAGAGIIYFTAHGQK